MSMGVITDDSGRIICKEVPIHFDVREDEKWFGTFPVPPPLAIDDFKGWCVLELTSEPARFKLLVSRVTDSGTLAHFCAIRL